MGQQILHVALADDWEGCLRFGEYDVATLVTPFDDTGYIHATTAARLPAVLAHPYAHVRAPLLLIVLDEQALIDAGIDVTWHTTGSGDRVPRIHAPFPMEPPIVTATIPIEHRDNRWIAPELSNPTGHHHASAAL